MEGQQTQRKRRFLWKRAIVALLVSLLICAGAILLILSNEHVIAAYWLVVIPVIFTVIALLIPLYQWLFPLETPSDPSQSPSLAKIAAQSKQPILSLDRLYKLLGIFVVMLVLWVSLAQGIEALFPLHSFISMLLK